MVKQKSSMHILHIKHLLHERPCAFARWSFRRPLLIGLHQLLPFASVGRAIPMHGSCSSRIIIVASLHNHDLVKVVSHFAKTCTRRLHAIGANHKKEGFPSPDGSGGGRCGWRARPSRGGWPPRRARRRHGRRRRPPPPRAAADRCTPTPSSPTQDRTTRGCLLLLANPVLANTCLSADSVQFFVFVGSKVLRVIFPVCEIC